MPTDREAGSRSGNSASTADVVVVFGLLLLVTAESPAIDNEQPCSWTFCAFDKVANNDDEWLLPVNFAH